MYNKRVLTHQLATMKKFYKYQNMNKNMRKRCKKEIFIINNSRKKGLIY